MWSDKKLKMVLRCEFGYSDVEACPCKGEEKGESRFSKALGCLGLACLQPDDFHYWEPSFSSALYREHLSSWCTTPLYRLICCQDCGAMLHRLRGRWMCLSCPSKIMPHDTIFGAAQILTDGYINNDTVIEHLFAWMVRATPSGSLVSLK